MGATRAMGNRRFEIPVWRGTEQAQEQNNPEQSTIAPMPAQEQDTAALMPAQEQDTAALMPMQKQDDSVTDDVQIPMNMSQKKRQTVPIQEKCLLTLEEAAEYTGLGMQKLRDISNFESCRFVLWNGAKRMFKRKKLEAYLEEAYSI